MRLIVYVALFSLFSSSVLAQEYPGLILTKAGVEDIKSKLGTLPKLDATLAMIVQEVDLELSKGIDVPVPKDLAGGYTHERHKTNFFILQKAGLLFQLTGDEKYADYIKKMLLEYAELFPKVDRHPATRSYARGKFFWQCLNDANWLVYTSQAYDCIYDWLDNKTRNKLNKELFRPMADFLSVETPQFFNRIHNHSTWGNAAVGMIGLVMDDKELVDRALYGLDQMVPNDLVADNDGGLIQLPGQKEAGFLAQIDHSFSPDGYYTEGPYYQRYAMYPFLIFAQALGNKKPELKIFEYRNGVLIKGVYALVNQTNSAGEFFPINDAQKGMSILSRELVTAMSMAYHFGGKSPEMLGLIKMQNRVPLNDTGLTAALALERNETKPLNRSSVLLRDGANGDEGALGILRSSNNENELSLVMKYTKHGMGHGHFDKLSFLYYHNDREVFQDYGAARWVNIEQKDGGGYLKENKTWAKQTIAHNTLVINNQSQYMGSVKKADPYHSDPYLFSANGNVQVMSAKENRAYSGVKMHRTMVLIEDDFLEYPLVLDLYRVDSEAKNSYDLPFYFQGAVMTTNFEFENSNTLSPMGTSHGYQHLWKEASGVVNKNSLQMSWFMNRKFYTLTSSAQTNDQLIFGRVGATDPKFNLRRDPVFMIRREDTGSTLFASTYEIHGSYSPVSELARNTYGKVQSIEVQRDDNEYSVVKILFKTGESWLFGLSNNNANESTEHQLQLNGEAIEWTGAFQLIKN